MKILESNLTAADAEMLRHHMVTAGGPVIADCRGFNWRWANSPYAIAARVDGERKAMQAIAQQFSEIAELAQGAAEAGGGERARKLLRKAKRKAAALRPRVSPRERRQMRNLISRACRAIHKAQFSAAN